MEVQTSSSSSSRSSRRLPKNYTIIDPDTKDTYLLEKEIGSASNGTCRVFRALYSRMENNALVPSGLVTLKTINKIHQDDYLKMQNQMQLLTKFPGSRYVVEVLKVFTTEEMYCVSLPYMSEGSLRYILSTRPQKRLPEDCIGLVLRNALHGLREVHAKQKTHKTFNVGDIFVHVNLTSREILSRLAFEASVYDSEDINVEKNEDEETGGSSSSGNTTSYLPLKNISKWGSSPEVCGKNDHIDQTQSDIWLFGVTALELAYGESLQLRDREHFIGIINKIRDKKKLPRFEKLLELERKRSFKEATMDVFKGKGKLFSGKKVKEERVFSKEFESMVIACLSQQPEKRPTVNELLACQFFTKKRDPTRFGQFLFNAQSPNPPTDK